MMAASAQRIADPEQQPADLAAEVRNLRRHILAFRTVTEPSLSYGPGRKPSRPRHLTAAQGGRQ
jgi:hypothetical protein